MRSVRHSVPGWSIPAALRGVVHKPQPLLKCWCTHTHTGTQEKEPGSDAFNLFFTDTASYIPPEGAESVEELYERTGQFLEELCGRRELEDKNILISTHGAAMTALLNRIKGNVTVAGFWKDEVPPNCSVTMVEVRDGQAAIVKEGVIYYREKVKKWKTV